MGGGAVAERKVRALIDTGARIQIVAETLSSGLEALVESDEAVWRRTKFAGAMLDAVWLVIAATGDRDLNRRIADAARARRVFINVVDDAALSSFHVPALIHRAPVQVAISSGGTAPALATAIRERLEASLDESLGSLATLLGRWRTRIKSAFPDLIRRRAFYRHVLKGTAGKAIRAGQTWAAESVISSLLKEQSSTDPPPSGWVALVGAGPGDAGLLTLRGLRLLGEADVILHDRLVSDEVLALARRDAEF
ncbi:MAG: SAM-dependent methyltransferase, partial [Gammaproteobacteria bacterium]|nr:SAM-dependent methyltransferase [Gammaproteobacteria bacterium]